MIETSPSALNSDMLQWIMTELKLWGLVEPVEKIFSILKEYSLKNNESIKKTVHDSEFGCGRYDWNKPKCSVFKHAPMNFDWTETLGIGRSGREQIWNFGKIFLEEQGVHKKMVHNSEFGWGRYCRNKLKCSVFEPAPMNSNWTETLGIGQVGWEKILNFDRIFLKEQGFHKKIVRNSKFEWGRYDRNNPQRGAMAVPYEKNWVYMTSLR